MLNPVKLPVAICLCLFCLLLTCFLADRPNVQDQSLVERLQHTYVEALHSYICINRPNVSAWPEHLQGWYKQILYLCRQSSCSIVSNRCLAACTVRLVSSGFFDSICKCRVCELSQSAACITFYSLGSMESLEFWDMMYFLCSFIPHPPRECWV